MQLSQSCARRRAMGRARTAQRESVEKRQQCGRTILQHRRLRARARAQRLGTGNAFFRKMLEQAQEERQIVGADPLFVQCENEPGLVRLQEIV